MRGGLQGLRAGVALPPARPDGREALGQEPLFDADVKVLGTIVLQNCIEYGVGRVVFASTGGVLYGEQRQFPATEDHPQHPRSPYGLQARLRALRNKRRPCPIQRVPYFALRHSNVYGSRQDSYAEAGVVAISCSGNLLRAGSPR